ncbi:hypothetical protein [Streptomyces sp. NPDC048200]|uniref:hypothetical protein n=1 Tax=Streptomyces sp. NPDC048200 TaxID=3365512 RepID=UPI00371B810A
MANIVWHKELAGLWDTIYDMDRLHVARGVAVAEQVVLRGGVCQDAGLEAPVYLRLRANGRPGGRSPRSLLCKRCESIPSRDVL